MSKRGDIDKMTNSSSFRYKEYEQKRLNHPLHRIDKANADFEVNITKGDRETRNGILKTFTRP